MPVAAPMVARVYLRVSTDAQDLERQEAITTAASAAGYYVAGIYREKASGARADWPELLRMIGDLQPGEGHCREDDRISRLPFARGRAPGGLDTGQRRTPGRPWRGRSIRPGGRGPGRRQDAGSRADHAFSPGLQMARDDYEDRRERQRQGIELARQAGRYKGRR